LKLVVEKENAKNPSSTPAQKKGKRDNQFEKEPKNSKKTHKKMPKSGINT
jgi:hypothetical protein